MYLKKLAALALVCLAGTTAITGDFPVFGKTRNWKNLKIPVGWDAARYSNQDGFIGLEEPEKGSSSGKVLRISSDKEKSRVVLSSDFRPVPAGAAGISVSMDVKYDLPGEGKIVFMGYGKDKKKSLQWKSLKILRMVGGWKKITASATLDKGVEWYRLSLRVNGKGTLRVSGIDVVFKGAKGKILSLLPGLKSWNDYTPDGAENTYKITRDDKSGVCSLEWKDGTACFGLISPKIPVKEMEDFACSCKFKTSGKGRCVLMVRILDAKGKLVDEFETKPLTASGGFKDNKLNFQVPKRGVAAQVLVLNAGEGAVQASDADFRQVKMKKAVVRFPVEFSCEPAGGNAFRNNGKKIFNSFVDSPCSLTFDFWGNVQIGKVTDFVIELPVDAKVLQCFNNHMSVKNPAVKPMVTEFSRDGKKWRRYTYCRSWALANIRPKPWYCRALTALFAPADGKPGSYPARCYVVANGAKGPEKSFTLRFLPPMKKTPNPRNYRVFMFSSFDMNARGDELFGSVLRKYEEAGITAKESIVWGDETLRKVVDETCGKRGWKCVTVMGVAVFDTPFNKYGDKAKAVNVKGRRIGRICPSFMSTKEGLELIENSVVGCCGKGGLKKDGLVLFDYEPWQSYDWCYCPACLKRFKEFSGIDATPAEIKAKYRKQWAEFRVRDTNAIVEHAAKMVKKHFPGAKVADYDYVVEFNKPGFESRFWNIPKDTRLSDKYLDCHYTSFYYYHGKKAFNFLDTITAKLKKPIVMFSLLARRGDPKQRRYARTPAEDLSPGQFRLAMLNGASAGTVGHAIFPGVKIDGEYFLAIDKTMREIAALEDFYRKGKRCDKDVEVIPDGKISDDAYAYRASELNGETAVTIFNFSKKPLAFKVIPGKFKGNVSMTDVSTGKKDSLTPEQLSKGITVKISPEDVALLKISPVKE